jgi:hypothetical protein
VRVAASLQCIQRYQDISTSYLTAALEPSTVFFATKSICQLKKIAKQRKEKTLQEARIVFSIFHLLNLVLSRQLPYIIK